MSSIPRRLLTSVLAAEALVLTGCGSAPVPEQRMADVERQSVSLTDHPAAVSALRDSSYRLGAAMLAAVPDTGPNTNRVTSPVSALAALAMLRVGARTTTAEEMDSVLGLPAEHRDEAMNALLTDWAIHDGDPGSVDEEEPPEDPLLHIANGLFVDEGLEPPSGFLEPLAQHYGAGVYLVDYSGDANGASDIMSAWVDRNTGGRIQKVPLEPTPETVLNIINTVYFAAAWADPFDPAATGLGNFTTNGEEVETPMMNALLRLAYAEGDGWQGVDLPYNNGFLMRLILPAAGSDPILDAGELAEANAMMDAAPSAMVALTLPSWDHSYDLDLKAVLGAMGLKETMGESPDLSGISEGIFVEGAAQSANITVGEKGTIAAAVTQLALAGSAPPEPDVELVFDRPFLYQILHEDTGMPLFLGTVMDPSVE